MKGSSTVKTLRPLRSGPFFPHYGLVRVPVRGREGEPPPPGSRAIDLEEAMHYGVALHRHGQLSVAVTATPQTTH